MDNQLNEKWSSMKYVMSQNLPGEHALSTYTNSYSYPEIGQREKESERERERERERDIT